MNNLQLAELMVVLIEPSSTQRRIITGYLNKLDITRIEIMEIDSHPIEQIQRLKPDLVISALYLSNELTGTDLIQQMRQDDTLNNTAFMLISSETRFRYLDPIRQAGVIAILPKPFSINELKIALNATLEYVDPSEVALNNYDPESLKVLIVDDSRMARKHIRRVLENMGLKDFTEAIDGAQGIELIHEHYFDLVVTDYNMPNMDGGELVDQIRSNSAQSGIPILMVTSESNENRLAAVQQSGVSAICDKPFEPSTVKQLLEQLFS
ncbi:MAG: response regulator [Candidatus Polarisedimenticolaceae bacterium]|nr:response regulator [Candidatus Polarisedimenticolaceae bacterium]